MKSILFAMLTSITFTGGTIYDFKVPGLSGEQIDFSAFKGKKILIVNTASECGLTPQYEELEKLFRTYQEQLIVVGFPANNFGGQEPGSNKEIRQFCKKNYGVSFPMAEKISVKGNDTHPLYQFLKTQAAAKNLADPVTWNFGKFLLNEEGELVATFSPQTKPMSHDILQWFN